MRGGGGGGGGGYPPYFSSPYPVGGGDGVVWGASGDGNGFVGAPPRVSQPLLNRRWSTTPPPPPYYAGGYPREGPYRHGGEETRVTPGGYSR